MASRSDHRSRLARGHGDDDVNEDTKWRRTPLKSSWYDDHFGWDASPREVIENRLGTFDRLRLTQDEEGVGAGSVERLFDLFDPSRQA